MGAARAWFAAIGLLSCLCAFAASVVHAEPRTALVIGNGAYTAGRLRNPSNDARAMATALRQCGFDVIDREDCDQQTMETLIRQFGQRIQPGGVGLFYYSGHGVQVGDANYLIPVGTDIQAEDEVPYKAVNAGMVLGKMESAGSQVNIIILDACRDNPFAKSYKSNTRGLVRMDAPSGSILAYATAPGKVAADGSGANGLYTSMLLKHMGTPGLPLELLFRQVRQDVKQATGGGQEPWESTSLTGDFYFVPPSPAPEPITPPPRPQPGPAVMGAGSRAGETRTFQLPGGASMEFVWIEPGSFTMGSPAAESNRDDDERPQHRVTISRGFWLGQYEVTQVQWQAVMGSNPSTYQGPSRPVERVSWNDVQGFIDRLNQAEGRSAYNLPTEAEWEYACRAGSGAAWSFGGSEGRLAQYAWFGDASGRTHEVGTKAPNTWGLYDMHGNVWEWCQDRWGSYGGAAVVDPPGPASGSSRVIRGGYFFNIARDTRSASRSNSTPDSRDNDVGVRLLRTP